MHVEHQPGDVTEDEDGDDDHKNDGHAVLPDPPSFPSPSNGQVDLGVEEGDADEGEDTKNNQLSPVDIISDVELMHPNIKIQFKLYFLYLVFLGFFLEVFYIRELRLSIIELKVIRYLSLHAFFSTSVVDSIGEKTYSTITFSLCGIIQDNVSEPIIPQYIIHSIFMIFSNLVQYFTYIQK